MPFENFYEEADKAARRWRKILAAAIFLVVGYCTLPFVASTISSLDTPFENKSAARAKRIERLDALCSKLPRPEQLFFVERETPKHFPDSSLVTYSYASDRPPEEILPTFIIWFSSNDWKSIADDGLIFRQGKQTVTIVVYSPFDTTENYKIICSETE